MVHYDFPEIGPLPPIRKWNVFYKLGSPQAAHLILAARAQNTKTKTALKNAIYPPEVQVKGILSSYKFQCMLINVICIFEQRNFRISRILV